MVGQPVEALERDPDARPGGVVVEDRRQFGRLGDTPFGSIEYQSIFAVGLLLFAVTLAMNVFSRWFLKRYREEYA